MKFIADAMLGKLCTWLRIMGHDCAFVPHDRRDTGLMLLEAREPGVVLLTRDTRLLAHTGEIKIMLFREQRWRDQLGKLLKELSITPDEKTFFTRCTRCNEPLVPVSREEALKTAPPRTAEHDYPFSKCPACGRLYWPGTHLAAVRREISGITRYKPEGR